MIQIVNGEKTYTLDKKEISVPSIMMLLLAVSKKTLDTKPVDILRYE